MHETQCVGVILELNAHRDRGRNSLVPPRLIDDRFGITVEQTQRDLREGAPKRPAEAFAAIVVNEYCAGVHQRSFGDVRTVNPWVSVQPAAGSLDVHSGYGHARKLSGHWSLRITGHLSSVDACRSAAILTPGFVGTYASCESRDHARDRPAFCWCHSNWALRARARD